MPQTTVTVNGPNIGRTVTEKDVKPGYQTTEFWKTIFMDAAMVGTLVFHQDLSSAVPALAVAAAGIANAAYAISRALAKK